MADKYLYSGAVGTGTGASWANAYTAMATAAAGMAAGDNLWVASAHSESTAAAITITFPGTAASPNQIISVNRAGSVPPVAADVLDGAVVTTTGTSSITLAGHFYMRGVTFNVGTGAVAASFLTGSLSGVFENCTINIVATVGTSRITLPSSPGYGFLKNCVLTFANASQGINGSTFDMLGGSVCLTGTAVTTMILGTTYSVNSFDGVDLSGLSGKTLMPSSGIADTRFINCKLPASITVQASGGDPIATAGVRVIGSNSTGNVERNEFYHPTGILTTETTVIRTAGASDGTTPYSWKAVSAAAATVARPFSTLEGELWNGLAGSSRTLTFHCLTDNVALNNNDIWVEVEYLGTAGNPQTTLVSSGPANILSTGSALTSDSGEAWTTTGIVTPNKQKFSVSFTPQIAGPIRWRVKVAKPSTTIYVDANPDLV